MRNIVHFDNADNVAVVLVDAAKGNVLELPDGGRVTVGENIPYGHKIALCDLKKGDNVVKYGEPVARCTANIAAGGWVHVHNCESIRGLGR